MGEANSPPVGAKQRYEAPLIILGRPGVARWLIVGILSPNCSEKGEMLVSEGGQHPISLGVFDATRSVALLDEAEGSELNNQGSKILITHDNPRFQEPLDLVPLLLDSLEDRPPRKSAELLQ